MCSDRCGLVRQSEGGVEVWGDLEPVLGIHRQLCADFLHGLKQVIHIFCKTNVDALNTNKLMLINGNANCVLLVIIMHQQQSSFSLGLN